MKTVKKSKTYCRVCPKWESKRPERCSNAKVVRGSKLFFRTARCKERFETAPEKFA